MTADEIEGKIQVVRKELPDVDAILFVAKLQLERSHMVYRMALHEVKDPKWVGLEIEKQLRQMLMTDLYQDQRQLLHNELMDFLRADPMNPEELYATRKRLLSAALKQQPITPYASNIR